ncbi:O-antigen ligase family protein [Acinetobacter bereziniae]|uniref:O-antigen ligase family protein n=1 Tax=Acinetobacter bereziniae TaxID=106648 RepID=UPI001902266C|nr:O-antigen ligase family protein [Acinetobacter bereziniae]MBJ8551669.1 O-antigen ligase family protein [Acinetobacter bereziniae]
MKLNNRNQITGALYLLLLFILGFSSTGSAFYNNYNPTVYMFYFIIPFLFFYKKEIVENIDYKLTILLLVMVCLFIVSSLISPLNDSFEIWWRLIGIITCIVFGYITKILLDLKAISFICINQLLTLIGLGHVIFLLYMWNSVDHPFSYNWVENLYFFTNIRHLADLLSICYFSALFLFLLNKGNVKYFYLISSIIILSCIFWSGSRAAYLGIFIAWSALFIYLNKKKLFIFIISLSFTIAVYISTFFNVASASLGFFRSFHRSVQGNANEISSSRLDLYQQIFDWFLLRPYWGYGGEAVRNLKVFLGEQQIGQAHNAVLQILIEYGLIGFIATTAVVVVIFKKIITQKNKIKIMCIAMLLNIFGASLLNGGAYYIIIIALFSVFVAIAYSEEDYDI